MIDEPAGPEDESADESADEEEVEVALEYEDRPDYEFVEGDARLRCFIFECVANAEIHGRILVENCEMAFKWIKTGVVPPEEAPKRRAATLVPR